MWHKIQKNQKKKRSRNKKRANIQASKKSAVSDLDEGQKEGTIPKIDVPKPKNLPDKKKKKEKQKKT